MTYTGDIGDIANALDEVEKQGKRNLTHLFASPPTKSQQLPVKQASQPEMEKGYASSPDNLALQPALQPAIEKKYASSLDDPVMQKRMSNIVEKTNEKEELKKSLGSILDHPVFEARFNKMFDDNSKEMEKKKYLPPYEQSKYNVPTKPSKQQS